MGGDGQQSTPKGFFPTWAVPWLHPLGIPGDELCSGWGWWLWGTWPGPTAPLLPRMEHYVSLPGDKAAAHIPVLFISFPSTKDPTWEGRYPGEAWCAGSWGLGG